MNATYSQQKSYADNRIIDLEIQIGDHVYFMISPIKRVMRFGKKGKLRPQYVHPYNVLQRVGKVNYELKLPSELSLIYPVFDISILNK